ncbi:MAG: ATP-binding protein, partial [Rivularia sp. (in: cyanobacteria)]
MMNLNDLPLLFDSKQTVVAIESPITERFKILEFVHELAQKLCLPLYFWNEGYSQLKLFNNNQQLISTKHQCFSGLNWLLQHSDITGIFLVEGVISPDTKTGKLSGQTEMMLSNLVYDLATNSIPKFIICMESYVEIPHSLAPLIPTLINPLPNPSNIKTLVQNFCNDKFSITNVNTNQYETLVRTCLGLPLGELEMLLKRFSRFTNTLEELIDGVLDYKKSKLK